MEILPRFPNSLVKSSYLKLLYKLKRFFGNFVGSGLSRRNELSHGLHSKSSVFWSQKPKEEEVIWRQIEVINGPWHSGGVNSFNKFARPRILWTYIIQMDLEFYKGYSLAECAEALNQITHSVITEERAIICNIFWRIMQTVNFIMNQMILNRYACFAFILCWKIYATIRFWKNKICKMRDWLILHCTLLLIANSV
jgi:hypothetical protein